MSFIKTTHTSNLSVFPYHSELSLNFLFSVLITCTAMCHQFDAIVSVISRFFTEIMPTIYFIFRIDSLCYRFFIYRCERYTLTVKFLSIVLSFFCNVPPGYATQKCTHNRLVYGKIASMHNKRLVFVEIFVNFHSVLKLKNCVAIEWIAQTNMADWWTSTIIASSLFSLRLWAIFRHCVCMYRSVVYSLSLHTSRRNVNVKAFACVWERCERSHVYAYVCVWLVCMYSCTLYRTQM